MQEIWRAWALGPPRREPAFQAEPRRLLAETVFHLCPVSDICVFGPWPIAERCVPCHKTEDTMLDITRPTPTCTRFEVTIEMPCIKCGERMRLALIEPRDRNFDLLTYRCIRCDSDESFLKPRS
jgi:hypothetical protein